MDISVIVPAYNCGPWLERCLDSLTAQTWESLEIVVVDDGSTDDTRQVLTRCAEKDHRIRPLFQENQGVTTARLRGVAEAVGAWIGFVDGDDVVEPWMYQRLLENAREHGADISHCGQQIVFPDGRTSAVDTSAAVCCQDHLTALEALLDGRQIESGLCTKLYRRELFQGLATWMDSAIRYNEDLLMNFYLFSQARSAVYQGVCPYHYLLREGSASFRRPPEQKILQDQIAVRQKILDQCPEPLRRTALDALLRNALFLYSWLVKFPEKTYDPGRRMVRQLLRSHRGDFAVLSRRNRVLAWLICWQSWAFALAYRVYSGVFQRQEEH